MLLARTLPAGLAAVLLPLRGCFTAPTFDTFTVMTVGMISATGPRTVCGMLTAAGFSRLWHHSQAHRLFSRAVWCPDQLGLAVARVAVSLLVEAEAPLLLAVDDTLFTRHGKQVYGASWQHDGTAHNTRRTSTGFGNSWVVIGLIVDLPFATRPVCLPIGARLWVKGGPGKQVLACQLIALIAAAFGGRRLDVVADCWYAGLDGTAATSATTTGRGLPAGVSLTSRLPANAALSDIAQPVPGAPGRKRRIGAAIGTPTQLAKQLRFQTTTVHRYGRSDQIRLAEHTCLWYGVYRSRAIRVILVRDTTRRGKARPLLALITTDLHTPAEHILARYAHRWPIETTFAEAKHHTGVGQARNHSRRAVERTVPFGLYVHTIVIIWYATAGHHPDHITNRRSRAPWYPTKTTPSYQDMITTARRAIITAKNLEHTPNQPIPQEILDLLVA